MKGRVACEISTGDELLLTEMIFNGAFNELVFFFFFFDSSSYNF